MAEQGRAVSGGMRQSVTAAPNPDERHAAPAGRGPALPFGGAAIALVGVGYLLRCRRTVESIELEEIVDTRRRGEDGPSVAIHSVKRYIAAIPGDEGVGSAVHEEDRDRL